MALALAQAQAEVEVGVGVEEVGANNNPRHGSIFYLAPRLRPRAAGAPARTRRTLTHTRTTMVTWAATRAR